MIQAVSSFHSEPAPTAAGIRSEPSNRNTAFGSCRIFTDAWSIALATLLMSRPLLALTNPPFGVALPFSLAQVSVDR